MGSKNEKSSDDGYRRATNDGGNKTTESPRRHSAEGESALALRLAVAVVVYNRKCADSAACRGLLAGANVTVFVLDNSTRDMGNAAWCAAHGWYWHSMGGNVGLPKAYNAAFNEAEGLFDALALFDDDTTVPPQYFERLRAGLADSPADVFVPLVRDEGGLLSPCVIHGHRVHRASQDLRDCGFAQAAWASSAETARPAAIRANPVAASGGEHRPPAAGEKTHKDYSWREDFTAINSGLALRLPVRGGLRYDEGYFLDYADHAFVRALKAAGATFRVLPVELRQAFSNNERGDAVAALRRYRLFRADFLRFCAGNLAGRVYGRLYLCKRALVLALRHRSAAFLPAALQSFDHSEH